MKILICDNEIKFLTDLKVRIEEYMNNRAVKFSIDADVDPAEILNNNVSYNLAFLNIETDKVNGLSLAKELKERNGKTVFFFVASCNKYQDEAMDLGAFRFFEKPLDPKRLYAGLDKAMKYIDELYVDFYLYSGRSCHRILVDDVMYIECQKCKAVLNSTQGQYVIKEKLEKWCDKLPNTFFYQVHKSFLVNLHYVVNYVYSELFLINGDRIPIASRKQADFYKYWNVYTSRR